MAIRKPPQPPGSITQPADNKNERIAEVSNVNRVVSEMQRKVDQQLAEAQIDIGEFEGIEDVQNSMLKVLSSLNSTVGTIGHGFAKIAADTGRASSDAIKQYGKAISEDIGINQRNVVATALAQSSPIFGYFAAKFVETDVFQSAKEKMKQNIGEALGGITSRFKEGFGNLISRARTKGNKEKPIKRIKSKDVIPKMQTGGYVEKGGLARLHPAEVVVPIDKILSRIDESIDVTKDLALISRRAQLNTLAKMSTYVKNIEKLEKTGIFKGFLRAMRQVQMQYQEPSDVRQLRALLAIQDAIGASITSREQVWQKMLVEHPFFRNMAFAMRGLGAVLGIPFKFVYSIFKSRGGYQAHLSKERNPFTAMVENIGLVYSEGMWRLDNIALFTKSTAQATRDLSSALTGKKYPPLEGVPTGVWSFANLAKRLGGLLTGRKVKGQKKALKELYGSESAGKTSRFSSIFSRRITKEAETKGALPVRDENLAKYMIENKKSQKKLLGYTADMSETLEGEYDVAKEMNRREKRRSIFGLFGGGFSAIKSLFSGFGMIKFLLLGAVRQMLTRLWTLLFPQGIRTALGAIISSTAVIGGFQAMAAAAFGTLIGTTIDKFIGVSEGFKAHLDRLDVLAAKVNAENAKRTTEAFAGSSSGDLEGYKKTEFLKIQSRMKAGKNEEYRKGLGWAGRHNISDIEDAQRKYMGENIGEYIKYGSDQLTSLRAKFIQEGGYPSKNIGYPALQYGAEREAAFLKYVQSKGKPLTEIQQQADFESYAKKIKKYNWQKGTIGEKMGMVFKEGKEIAKEELAQAMAQTEAMKKAIKDQTEKVVASSKEAGHGMATAVNQATNQVTTSITNSTRVVNNAAQRVRDIFSEYDHAIIKGDYMSEGF